MNYTETLDYLFTRLPMFSRIGAAAYKADLVNTIRLCNALNNPQQDFRSIHIAGTNGKGSTSHMLAAILQSAGYKTGLYTSPHLKDFRERIRIDGKMISENEVIDFTERMQPLIEDIQPSFFEITVAMAFDHFKKHNVDIAVIETGLGGRLDSTNIITPELCVITNIGYDHMNMLGDTLEKIAGEKAGIIKENIPVVVGEWNAATAQVFIDKAASTTSPVIFASQKRSVQDWNWKQHQLVVEVSEEHHTDHKVYKLDLQGIYQTKNLLTVIEACSQLQQLGWKIDEPAIQHGLAHTKKMTGLHGRWEPVYTEPLVVLDVAHNEDGIRQLVQQIELTSHRELHIVLGMVADKEIDKVLSLLPKHAHYYFTKAQIPRAMDEEELRKTGEGFGLKGDTYPNVNNALEFAIRHTHPDDMVVVCGSVFLVGEVKEM